MTLCPDRSPSSSSTIAVVGMAGRFPGARNVHEFWRNLSAGVESIRSLTDEQLLRAGVDPELLNDPNYVKISSALDDVEMFDASFFGFSPRDAAILDPQQRHFLECCWEALEDAGWDPQQFPGTVGVYAGSGFNGYLVHNLLPNKKLMKSAGEFVLRQTGNDKDVLATRASYHLNLTGPSMTIQTACSTSLVAIHAACQSLLNFECDMALAGGVTIEIPSQAGYEYREGEILSRDGHCRSFDARSSGTVFGSGAALVVLRRLEDALADRDQIHAVILGSAINNDGSRKVGYLAPSVAGQAEVVAEALSVAGVDADSISYVEAHGTGTLVGDPIEISGLTAAFRQSTERRGYCAIGSVKSNIGHLDAAAGAAGFIKTVQALKHRQIPPSLNFSVPNPLIDFENSPFFVNTELRDWPTGVLPPRAGVTSLGIGGTNAHVVLQEAPRSAARATSRRFQLLTISARTDAALDSASARLTRFLEEQPDIHVGDVAFTLHRGRKRFAERRAIVCQTAVEAAALLRRAGSARTSSAKDTSDRPVVFLFSGQGSQYADMGRGLYETEPVFRSHVDECSELLRDALGLDLRTILYPGADSREEAERLVSQTGFTQPALFVIEYALAKLWESWGIRPEAMLGHSVGEFAVACLAGVMTLEEALSVIAERGRLMQALPAGGAMLAVGLAEAETARVLNGSLSLAAVNGPRQCVISGAASALRNLESRLTEEGVSCHSLQTSHAFHSALMQDAVAPFVQAMSQVRLQRPNIPFISNVTGDWITSAQATDPEYWGQHLRQPVRFAAGLEKLFENPSAVLLEIGPGRALSGLASKHPAKPREQKVIQSLRTREDATPDDRFVLTALGELWTAGVGVDWVAFHRDEQCSSASLPTYPFEHQRFWVDAPKLHPEGQSEARSSPLDSNPSFAFYRPAWKRSEPSQGAGSSSTGPWLIFSDETGVGSSVEAGLARRSGDVITVIPGTAFRRINNRRYELRPGQRRDYDDLLADLLTSGKAPAQVLHLWALGGGDEMDRCFYSLLYWAQSIGDQDLSQPIHLTVVSNSLQQVASESILEPKKAVLAGPCRIIPKEYPNISCRWIDLALPAAGGGVEEAARTLIAELGSDAVDAAVALRQNGRWVQSLEPVRAERNPSGTRIRRHGVYLITGGLGGVGIHIAEHLARTAQAKLILMGRTELPERSEWPQVLSTHSEDPVAHKIRAIQQLEALGAEVLAASGDVCDPEDVERVIRLGQQVFGAIHGVIHAAGVLDDGLIQLKTRESASRVLDPKVTGTLVLEAAFEGVNLDFFALCSSISNWLAPVGQVDYVAASAFLDAFALSRSSKTTGRVIAIGWGRWRNVGMAADPKASTPSIQPGVQPVQHAPHPFLGRCIVDSPQTALYTTELRLKEQWILSEHAFRGGDGLFPGTGYIEMAQAMMLRHAGPGVIQVEDLAFLSPIWVGSEQSKSIQIGLKKDGQDYAFRVSSIPEIAGATSAEHVSATVRHLGAGSPENYDLAGALARCKQRELDLEPERTNTKQARFIDFGPRFRCLKRIYFGLDEAVSYAELDDRFSSDLDEFHTHPALLDTAATGSAMFTIREYDQTQNLYIPASYKRITLFAPLPRRFYCHIRSKPENTIHKEVASFDITVIDENGQRLVEIEEFAIRRVTDSAILTASQNRGNKPARLTQGTGDLKALEPAHALEALEVILNGGPSIGSLVIVAPAGLMLESGTPGARTRPVAAEQDRSRDASVHATSAGAPDEIEQCLIEWLSESLGVTEISVEDDFFELGGDSLCAVRLFAKIKKTFGADLGLAKLFEARTIRALAGLVRGADGATGNSCIIPIRAGGTKTPVFMVHGVGGHVLTFTEFSNFISPGRPVYGIQSQALDRSGNALTTVEQMAAYYLREVRAKQPVGPYAIMGYSFGSIVAYEMAQQLHAAGERVALLGVIDFLLNKRLPLHKRALRFLKIVGTDLAVTLRGRGGLTHLFSRLKGKAVRLVYTVSSVAERPAPQSVGTAFDINWFAAVNYKPRPYPGRLNLICSTQERVKWDPEMGWGNLAAQGLDIHELPGNHFEMFSSHAPALAAIVENILASKERPADAAIAQEQIRR